MSSEARKYRLSRQAQEDLLGIARYISKERPQAAVRVIQALRESLRLIASNPLMGTDCNQLRPGLRMFVASRPANRYAIFFRPSADDLLEIVAVVDSARDWETLLGKK